MAIPITDVIGTTVYLAPQGTAVTTPAEATAAIAAGKKIAYLQDLGTISETRTVTEYSDLEGVDSQKSIGTLSFGNFQLDVLYDYADALGQADMTLMWESSQRRELIIVMSNNAGTSPSYVTFEVALSSQDMEFVKDGAVKYMNTAEQTSKRVLIKATV